MPGTFIHISSVNLYSHPSVTAPIFPDGRRDVACLTPGHMTSLQKNPGLWPEASDLSLAILEPLCGSRGPTCEALVRATGQVLGGIFQQGVQVLCAGGH